MTESKGHNMWAVNTWGTLTTPPSSSFFLCDVKWMLTDSHIWNSLRAQYQHMTDQFEDRCAKFFFRSTIISFSPSSLRQSGWPPLTHYVSKHDLKLLNFLSPKCWYYRRVPPLSTTFALHSPDRDLTLWGIWMVSKFSFIPREPGDGSLLFLGFTQPLLTHVGTSQSHQNGLLHGDPKISACSDFSLLSQRSPTCAYTLISFSGLSIIWASDMSS